MAVEDQVRAREGEASSESSDASRRILSEQAGFSGRVGERAATAAVSQAMVSAQTLPDLRISGAESTTRTQQENVTAGAVTPPENATAAAAAPQENTTPAAAAPQESTTPAAAAPQEEESTLSWFLNAAGTVISDIATGAINEITENPLGVIVSGAAGLAIGTAAAFASPVLLTVGAVGGALYGGYQLASHAGEWAHSASVVANESDHTAEEVAAAHQTLQGVGAGSAHIGAGVAGGMLASPLISSVSSSFTRGAATAEGGAASATAEGGAASGGARGSATLESSTAAETTATAESATARAGATGETTATAESATARAGATGETAATAESATARAGATSETTAAAETTASERALTTTERAALTTEQVALQESIANNQAIFRTAQESGQIIPSVKQSYSVRFERVGPGGQTIQTLENPAGVQVAEGNWIATRLNADGTPNIENGIMNRWTPSERDITSKYLVTPEQLAAAPSEITALTNTSAPPVHMVRLSAPIEFQTEWGPMRANAGDYLANYNFNPATGQPGNNFAAVTARSYEQTYRPV